MWKHTVIEIYQNNGEWPTEGQPAEWIEKRLVSWCQGTDDTVIHFAPLKKIAEVLLKRMLDKLSSAYYNITHRIPFVRARRDRRWEALWEAFADEVEWVD